MLKLHTVQCNFKSYLSYLLSAPYLYDSMPMIYLCKFCKSSFKNILAVKRHIFKDHLKNECGEVNVKLYCTIDNCGEQLNSASALRKHRFRHHKGKQWTVPTNWYQCMSGCSSLPADEVDILVPKENNIKLKFMLSYQKMLISIFLLTVGIPVPVMMDIKCSHLNCWNQILLFLE